MELSKHPGYLGPVRGSLFSVHHADWPTYPMQEGWAETLECLGQFPPSTVFRALDDIDRSWLLIVDGLLRRPPDDDFDSRHFHLAVWHEDLLALAEEGLVEGVYPLTEREWRQQQYDDLRQAVRNSLPATMQSYDGDPLDLVRIKFDGRYIPLKLPPLESDDDATEDEEWDDMYPGSEWSRASFAGITPPGVMITEAGWRKLQSMLVECFTIPERIRGRLENLLEHEMYDTAVREVAVSLESAMRSAIRSDSYGEALVRDYTKWVEDNGFIPAWVKYLKGNLRTTFRFIRNPYAHRRVEITKQQAYAILSPMCRLFESVDEINRREPSE